ncbi:MAG TPA: hypothetical protein PKK12_03005 [Candidatus Aminicenantes bacterium]|nr:hypothetical protein [Candidatus Aminicenantes bacterium]
MKTYEEFLEYLTDQLRQASPLLSPDDDDFYPAAFTLLRFLLSEPYRWESRLASWPPPPRQSEIPETELLSFFSSHKGLLVSFGTEWRQRNFPPLRAAHAVLFPLLVEKDDLATALYWDGGRSRRFKQVVRDLPERATRVREKLAGLTRDPRFLPFAREFVAGLMGFSLTLLSNRLLLDQAIQSARDGR